MTLSELLREHQETIVEKWIAQVYNTYPIDTVGFLRKGKDEFQNPVAHRTSKAIESLVEALLADGLDSDAALGPLDDLIRIRAVQDFSPAQAIGAVYFVKSIIRGLAQPHLEAGSLAVELLHFESKIDSLALMAVNIYTQCKSQVHEIRIKEIKNSQAQLLKRAGMICDTPAEEPYSNPSG